MKYFFFFCLILVGCGTNESKPTSDSVSTITQNAIQVDTSCAFIKHLLNCSPKEVAKTLGAPDNGIKASKDCDDFPSCSAATYQNSKYEVLYYKNMLKWVQINKPDISYDENAVKYVGFMNKCSYDPKQIKYWYSWDYIPGIKMVRSFPNGKKVDYILVVVKEDFDGKF